MKKRFAVIDIETTGGMPKRDKITEIAVVLFNGKEIIDQFVSLINPERSIPPEITRITGITNEMVKDAPKFYEIAKQIVKMTEGAVFVAHNVRFDYSFLKNEFKSLGFTYTRRQLCTVRLTRKTSPNLESYGLGRLIQHFRIDVKDRHRALDDALVATELLKIALSKQKGNKEAKFLINQGISNTQLPKNLNTDKLHALPEECGVYYFHNEFDQVIYVGKAINIQKRAFQHFRKIGKKAANLYQRVYDISFELTGSELLALLTEAREIKRINPEINKALKNKQYNYVIFKEKNEAGYLELKFARNSKKWQENPNIVRYVTNMKATRSFLSRQVDQFELCAKLCHIDERTGPCFFYSIKKCLGACIQDEPSDSYNARVEAAITLSHDRFDQDIIVEEQSLDKLEKVLFLVQNGKYIGHTVIHNEEDSISIGQIEKRIPPIPFHPEYNRIIFNYLLENPHVKVHFL